MPEEAKGPGRSPQEEQPYAEAIVRTVRQPLLVLSGDLVVEAANPAFYRTFGVAPEETSRRRQDKPEIPTNAS